MQAEFHPNPGAILRNDGSCRFVVWAPHADEVSVKLSGALPGNGVEQRGAPPSQTHRMIRHPGGYHEAVIADVEPGTRYVFRLDDDLERPDPASRWQPDGPHGASAVVSPHFDWTDGAWLNPPLHEHVFYELHVGAFTPQGTFDAVIERLDDLVDLGVTAIELMPVAQFPGSRNWGYDGVGLYAAQESYGGPEGLRRLVDAAHARGLAVALDVVYNHLGPEGNYLRDFGPYFTDRYHTPWGEALNFDGPNADAVRNFFIRSACYWVDCCHVDALRLDAVHAIVDNAAVPFVEELTAAVHDCADRLGRRVHVIAESAANDARLLRPRALGGMGTDAQWNDDFHHALHAMLTGERTGYYQAFGRVAHVARAFRDGYVYTGQYSPFFKRRYGRPACDAAAGQFVVFAQNHDQVGNRMNGERLSTLAGYEAAKVAAALVLLSPFVPLLFMGEEYAESAPFLYFVSHTDAGLVEAVRHGRREEFASFEWAGEPPDPQAIETFERSRVDWSLRQREPHRQMLDYYRELITLRRDVPALARGDRDRTAVEYDEQLGVLTLRRWQPGSEAVALFNLSPARTTIEPQLERGGWRRVLDSGDPRFGGPDANTPDTIDGGVATSIDLGGHIVVVYEQGES